VSAQNTIHPDMTLRDRFAWQIFEAGIDRIACAADYARAANSLAAQAYIVADAMMVARALSEKTP
jgi:precorrin isomerase